MADTGFLSCRNNHCRTNISAHAVERDGGTVGHIASDFP
jgi:hypothetical protein